MRAPFEVGAVRVGLLTREALCTLMFRAERPRSPSPILTPMMRDNGQMRKQTSNSLRGLAKRGRCPVGQTKGIVIGATTSVRLGLAALSGA